MPKDKMNNTSFERDINSFFDGKCGEQSCWFGFEGEGEPCRRCLAAYLKEKGYCRTEVTVKEFAKFLIDKAEAGAINIGDITDLCYEFLEGEE